MSETTRPHQPRVCGECKHWKRWIDEYQDAAVDKGICYHPFPLMVGSFSELSMESSSTVSTYATFGCNQWESNNASE